jgi:hypothetical protein
LPESRRLRQAEQGGGGQAEEFARLAGEGAADDQVDAAAGAHFVEQHFRLVVEGGNRGAVLLDLLVIGVDVDHVAHGHLRDVALDGEGAGIFLGVEEDRGDLVAQAEAAVALVGDEGNVVAGPPQHGVGGRLARGAGADHVADVGDRMALLLQVFDQLHRAALAGFLGRDAVAGILQHGQRMQRDVGAAPGIGRGREVVGVGFAGDLEHGDGDLLRHFGALGEPFGIGPGLHHGLGVGAAGLGLVGDVVEEVEHQQRGFERLGGDGADHGVVQHVDQRLDVVAADHGAEQFGGLFARDQRAGFLALRHAGQELGLDLGRVIDAGRHAVGDQVDQGGLFALGRVLQQCDQFAGLLLGQGQGRDAEGGAFGDVLAIGFKHGEVLSLESVGTVWIVVRRG